MNSKIGILLTSRNNYQMLKNWYISANTNEFDILNIDEDSEAENKKVGAEICAELGIAYMDRDKRGMQNNLTTAGEYFKDRGIEWVIWFQHDCWPLESDFFTKINQYLNDSDLNEFGVVGFNCYHSERARNDLSRVGFELNDTARTPLEPGDKWYRNKKYWNSTRVDYNSGKFDKPFAVESVAWYCAMVNIDQYFKYIIPTDEYHFFHAWDDIAFQFLNNNVYNICIPSFNIGHFQNIKANYDIPINSPKAAEKRDYFYSKWGHLDVWKKRWGFSYEDRKTFEMVKDRYKDTLLWNFYHHDPINGPLKSFDI